MQKLLVICGPTSTGKTRLSISLAKKFDGEIISADSRQVYKGMDIGTGKDLPKNVKIKFPWFGKYGYYEVEAVPAGRQGVKIWGYDLADPRHEYNVSQYIKFVKRIVADILKRGKLPILVGGTGLYIKAIVDGIPTAEVPKNENIRKSMDNKNVDELFNMFAQLDPIRAGQMNSSDKGNPRRLIRAIEIAMWGINHQKDERKMKNKNILFNSLQIGLGAPQDFIDNRIKMRVSERIKNGIKNEVLTLLKSGVKWESQSMSSMGYGIWRDYFENVVDEDFITSQWIRSEIAYSKRQMTWFKKDTRIKWFDVSNAEFAKNVDKLVKKWYL